MPSKSKRNRRISQNKNTVNTTNPVNATVAPAAVNQPARSSAVYASSSTKSAASAPMVTDFGRDLKWIGFVTVIIIVLLVLSYMFFR